MSDFNVKPTNLKSTAGDIGHVQHSVRAVGSEVQSVIKNLGMSSKDYAAITRNLKNDLQNIQKTEVTLRTMKSGTEKIAALYQTTEKSIIVPVKKKTGVARKVGQGAGVASTIWERISRQYKKRMDREAEAYRKLARFMKDTAGWWVDKYKKHKGTIDKIVKTGKAVATIAGSVVAIGALWGLTAGSAGVGTPLAALGTIYAGDAITNSVCDIIDIWGGNPGHAGKNHALQDALKKGGGELGEMLGNKKLGETIGNGLYYTGKIVSVAATVEAVAGKVIQGPDMWSEIKQAGGEIGSGFKGVIDIVTKTPISRLKYDMTLLGYEVPHIVKVVECGQIISEVKDTTEKIVNAGVSFITDTIDTRSAAMPA